MKILQSIILVSILSVSCGNNPKSGSKGTMLEHICNCITQIDEAIDHTEQIKLSKECFQVNIDKHGDYLNDLAKDYLEKHPDEDINKVDKKMRDALSKKLVQNCSRLNKIVTNKAFSNSKPKEDIIVKTSREICERVNKLDNHELTWENLDPIIERQIGVNSVEINRVYNFNDESSMTTFTNELVQELVLNCDKYRIFTAKMN